MAVAHDAASASHASGSNSVSQASFSWTHTPVGTPAGVLIFTYGGIAGGTGSAESATSVTYGGGPVTAVTGGSAADTATEPMRCTAWFLGSGLPTGAQTVIVNRVNSGVSMWAVAVTVTASGDTEVHGVVLQQENQVLAETNVDDGSPGTNSVRYVGIATGVATPSTGLTTGANSTRLFANDNASRGAVATRETTAGQGSRPVGESGASDDLAAVYLAIREVAAGGGGGNPWYHNAQQRVRAEVNQWRRHGLLWTPAAA